MYRALHVKGSLEGFKHKLIDVLLINPCCAEPDINFRSFQVFGLRGAQCLYVNIEIS